MRLAQAADVEVKKVRNSGRESVLDKIQDRVGNIPETYVPATAVIRAQRKGLRGSAQTPLEALARLPLFFILFHNSTLETRPVFFAALGKTCWFSNMFPSSFDILVGREEASGQCARGVHETVGPAS